MERAPQVARSEAEGRRHQGRLFLAYLILAKQKKVSRPPRRQSGTGLSSGGSARVGSKEIRERAFSGSEHKFPSTSSHPSGASQGNCDPTPKTHRLTSRRNCDPTLKTSRLALRNWLQRHLSLPAHITHAQAATKLIATSPQRNATADTPNRAASVFA